MDPQWYQIGYLISATFFIFGLKMLGHPRTAPRGNQMGAIGMLIACLLYTSPSPRDREKSRMPSSA